MEHAGSPGEPTTTVPFAGRPAGPPPSAPRRIGRYDVTGEVGRGGAATVYRAFDPALQRTVAVKVLAAADPIAGARQRQRFQREALAVARLSHPGIVKVHEVGEHDGRPYLVMELVDGPPGLGPTSLEGLLGRGPLAPTEIAALLRDVAGALEHAHLQGLVHRDVKPGNILIDRERRPVLSDFGLAQQVEGEVPLTATGQLLGTPVYMAPEQVRGAGGVGPAADVYALGGTLYRALAGRPPFTDASLVALLRRILADEPPALPRAAVHPDLATITMKCLEKEPARRYASAAELAADLDRFCRGEPIAAQPIGRLGRARRWAGRNRALAALAAALALTALSAPAVGATVMVTMRRRARAERLERVREAGERADAACTSFARERAARERRASGEGEPLDELLIRGMDALEAASTHWNLVAAGEAGDDSDERERARRRLIDAALACKQVAIEAKHWNDATRAIQKARSAGLEDEHVTAALAEIQAARERARRERRDAVRRLLAEALDGEIARRPDGFQDALIALVKWPEPQTVEILAAALDEVSTALEQAKRDALLSAVQPTPEEARAGERPLAGLAEALDRLLARPPGSTPDAADVELAEAAARRLELRAARGRSITLSEAHAPGARAILADAQTARLAPNGPGAAPDEITRARLCCTALGHMRIRERAAEALARYLRAEEDETRARAAGIALARLGGAEQIETVLRARTRFGAMSTFWRGVFPHVRTALEGSEEVRGAPPSDLVSLVEWGLFQVEVGRLDRAREAARRALAIDDAHADAWRLLAAVERDDGDLAATRAALDRAVALSAPDYGAAWNDRGVLRLDHGDIEGALSDLVRAVEADPERASAWAHLGLAHQRAGEHEAAVEALSTALGRAPDEPSTLADRSVSRQALGDLAGARADAERAVAIAPDHVPSLIQRALVRRAEGDLDGALEDLTRAVDLEPSNPIGWTMRGHLRSARGELAAALADLDRAVALGPPGVDLIGLRGSTRHRAGDLAGAVADLLRAVEIDPGRADAWCNLGCARNAQGDHEAAVEALERALEIDEALPEAWSNLGFAHNELGDFDAAAEALDRALALEPDSFEAWMNLGFARLGQHDAEAALTALDRAVTLAPGDARPWASRGSAHMKAGDLPAARADLERATSLDPHNAVAFAQLGVVHLALGDDAAARTAFDRAIELSPGSSPLWNNRASVRLETGDARGALADATRAIELDPKNAFAWSNRGRAHETLDDLDAALEAYDRAIELDQKAEAVPIARSNRARVRERRGDRAGAMEDLRRFIEIAPGNPEAPAARERLAALEKGEPPR